MAENLLDEFARDYLASIGNTDPSLQSVAEIVDILESEEDLYRPFKTVYEHWLNERVIND